MSIAKIDAGKISGAVKVGFFNRIARRQLFKLLKRLPAGRLEIEEQGQRYSFGESAEQAEIVAYFNVHHVSAYRDILLGGSIGAGESYMSGKWSSNNLVDVVRLMALNIDFLNGMDDSRFLLQRLADKLYHWLNRNTEVRAKRNISAHYDLSNDFFALFLDPGMMYSAAVFPHQEASLEQASNYKLDLVCRKLQLSSEDHLLEIGSGWGGLAVYAATHYGCRVTTTTISEQQYEYSLARVEQAGLGDRVKVLLEDYRKLEGKFDKLVSIEMIEAVGHQFYRSYFSSCAALLKPEGLMLLQAITIPDQRYHYARKSVDFIQRYIFPGGCLPSHEVIAQHVRHSTDMQIVDIHEIGNDYARTLNLWRERFHAQQEKIMALGFDRLFMRMWEYYLCYCEGGFRERAIGTSQLLFAKPEWRATNSEKGEFVAADYAKNAA